MTSSVNYNVAFAGNLKSALFGGAGLFIAMLTGPGSGWLQSLPFSKFAGRIVAAGRKTAGSSSKQHETLSLYMSMKERI